MKTNNSERTFFPRLVSCHGGRRGSVVGHVSGGGAELGVGLDDLVDGLQEVLLGGDLPARSDGEHAGLCAHAADLGTWQGETTSGQRCFYFEVVSPC